MKTLKLYFFTASLVLFGTFANAQHYWAGRIDDNWNDAGNWTDGAGNVKSSAPTGADNVIFDGSSPDIVNFISTIYGAATANNISIINDYPGLIIIESTASLTCSSLNITSFQGIISTLPSSNLTINGEYNNSTSTDIQIEGEFYARSFISSAGNVLASNCPRFVIGSAAYVGSGAFNIDGCNFDAPTDSLLIFLGSGTFSPKASGGFNSNNGIVKVTFASNKTLPSGFTGINSFHHFVLEQTSNTNRILQVPGDINITGNFTIITPNSSGGIINLFSSGTRTISVSGNLVNNQNLSTGTYSPSANLTILLNGNSSQQIIGNTLNTTGGRLPNITINQSTGGSISFSNRINFGRNLTINSNGAITKNSSTLSFVGNLASTLSGTTTNNLDLYDLLVDKSGGSLTVGTFGGSRIGIENTLTVTAGTFNTGDKIVLQSTASNTAQLAAVGGTISGNMTVQRFIPARTSRRWRFLAAPITAASGVSIRNGWQSQIFITGAGTGSGPVGTANYNSNGFDWTASNTPSIYTYNENQNKDFNTRWESPATTTGVNLTAGTGYRVFIRGDRSNTAVLSGGLSTQAAVTLAVTGQVKVDTLHVPITCSNGCTSDDGWNLIGNPYPATIDWNTIRSDNSSVINNTYTTFDPNSGASGAYVSWNGTTGDAGRYISSGQAFWVKSTSASANLTFTESHKAITQVGSNRFKSGSLTNHMVITLSGNGFNNKAFVHQNTTGAYGKDNYDAVKFGYGSYQIATFEPGNNTKYDINNLPLYGTKTTDTVEVEVNVPATAANYQLSFADVNTFNSNLKVYLQDKMLNTLQDLSTANTYSFATNGTAGSTGNRFRVLITNQSNPLPVVFTALEANLNNNITDLKWSTLSEKNNAKFIVERSIDMVNFIEIGLVKAVGNSNVKNTYTFTDVKPESYTTNYYRIKQVDFDGKFAYSNIASITTDIKGNGVNNTDEVTTTAKVFPVPTKDVLNIEQLDGTTLTYSIVDVFGSEVLNGTTEITENGSSINVSTLANGIYFLVAKTDNGMATKTRFIVE